MGRQYVTPDYMGLVAEAATRRIPQVLGKLAARCGGTLTLSEEAVGHLSHLRLEHMSLLRQDAIGGHTAERADAGKLRAACQWLVSLHCELSGQPEKTLDPIPDSALYQAAPCKAGMYRDVLTLINEAAVS